MLEESIQLANNISTETTEFVYSDKNKGAGYARRLDTTTTIQYLLDNFTGSIKIQGSLDRYPGNDDWVDVTNTVVDEDSTVSNSDYTFTFNGNFVWLRAAYKLTDGTILSIRYSL